MPVERQFAELRRRKLGKAFCSSECWYAHAQRENNPVWTGGQHERINSYYRKWRKAVLERDFYECANCHSAERLEAHHIVRFNADASRRWDVTNGITLCRQCHQVIRGREEEYEKLLSFAANIPREVWS